MAGSKGMTHYSLAIKLQAVDLHEQEGMPYSQVAGQLGIRKAERIEKWCRAYRREGELAFHKPIGRPHKDEPGQVTLDRLRMENALLEKFRSELHRTMLARRNIGSLNTTEESTL